MKYRITFTGYTTVEADNETEAEQKVYEQGMDSYSVSDIEEE